ncbi:family 2 glycosyl transferase [Nitritalea halalkaliphila LW7]|uniref:Family 2 glycosyl transferase n=1 Tax=Nitritalea halalkaliphila LW7 TaxID=1189621 RepID=I5C1X2_9BACT|nr:glycosyltransferase family 2 protein [Nitritalea halalkaliphila]EIM75824.1 family 2 glycosyl transferase [Nitritalea halalkaliphila LW7]
MKKAPQTLPKVSLVTVNFNTTAVTRELLCSLRAQHYPNLEIILVDNGSKEPCAVLAEEFPEVIYVDTGQNLGFAGGNNAGMEKATGDYFLWLNNDTEVAPDFLFPLVERFAQNPTIGMVSPKIYFYDAPNTLQFAGFGPISSISGRGFSIGLGEQDEGQFEEARAISRPHGAAMMFSRALWEKIGPMPEVYFLYYEEMDYAAIASRAGFSIWYEPKSRVWHKESMSTGKQSPLKAFYYGRNRLLYLRRHTRGSKNC